jgi:hypothetical protein
MIPYAELDRALARWKARSQGGATSGVVDGVHTGSLSGSIISESSVVDDATPMPISAEELGSIPRAAGPMATEGTGEIDASELEAYEEDPDQK